MFVPSLLLMDFCAETRETKKPENLQTIHIVLLDCFTDYRGKLFKRYDEILPFM